MFFTFRRMRRGVTSPRRGEPTEKAPCSPTLATQIHPTCIPVSGEYQSKLTLMSESLRNDGRVWVPNQADIQKKPSEILPEDRDYYLERKYPALAT